MRVDPQNRAAAEISGPTFVFAFRAGDGAITQNTAGQRPVITRSACGGAAGSERPARFNNRYCDLAERGGGRDETHQRGHGHGGRVCGTLKGMEPNPGVSQNG